MFIYRRACPVDALLKTPTLYGQLPVAYTQIAVAASGELLALQTPQKAGNTYSYIRDNMYVITYDAYTYTMYAFACPERPVLRSHISS